MLINLQEIKDFVSISAVADYLGLYLDGLMH